MIWCTSECLDSASLANLHSISWIRSRMTVHIRWFSVQMAISSCARIRVVDFSCRCVKIDANCCTFDLIRRIRARVCRRSDIRSMTDLIILRLILTAGSILVYDDAGDSKKQSKVNESSEWRDLTD